MKNAHNLESISKLPDDELLRNLSALLKRSRRVEAELIAHIGEVDRRRLYAARVSSMFVYCVEVLHLSEAEAYLRINVARAARRHPVLLDLLADGRLHLSGIKLLIPHLTETNREARLERATHQSKRKIEELVAEIAPKPDVAASMRKLPERGGKTPVAAKADPEPAELVPEPVGQSISSPAPTHPGNEPRVVGSPARPAPPAKVKPLAPERYKITFTASAELRDKLERLRGLMRSSVPDGDLATLIEVAVTEKLEKLETKRYGQTKAPRKSLEQTDTSATSRTIPAAVRRAVYMRDQGRCRFEDENGRRCSETEGLEFHHVVPYGRGGDHDPSNIRLMCRIHNLYEAEAEYGRTLMNAFRRLPSGVSEPAPMYISLAGAASFASSRASP
jgi:hypothetical protein